MLGIAPESLRVLSHDVGGNFGTRNRTFVEFGLVLWAAKKLGRPVKFTATRSEAFLSDYQGRDLVTKVELALDDKHRFIAMRATNISNVGARCVSLSPLSKGSGLIPGSYAIPATTLRAMAVFTNTMPTNAYRSSGRPEVTFAIERLVDTAAAQLGVDRIALRRKNLVPPKAMPYRNAVGMLYDSGRYEENMDWAMEIADWKGFAARRREAKRRGKLLGPRPCQLCGILDRRAARAGAHQGAAGRPRRCRHRHPAERAGPRDELRASDFRPAARAGRKRAHHPRRHRCGERRRRLPFRPLDAPCRDGVLQGRRRSHRQGQGDRRHRHGRGDRTASRSADGRFVSRDTNRTFDFLELAAEAARHKLPEALKDGLAVVTDNEMHEPVFPNGTAICEVEIDPDTGEIAITRYASVDDVGRCINPLIVHGQTHGAIAQGVGQAMWEQIYLDPDSGQPLTGSLMDYGMPRADTLPSFTTEIAEVLSPTNPLGIKAGGEGGTTAAPAVMVSAILDALRELGVRDMHDAGDALCVWTAIQQGQSAIGRSADLARGRMERLGASIVPSPGDF